MIEFLSSPQMEIFSWVSGTLCVWLITRENIWNWPIGMTNNVLLGLIFWNKRLYGQTLLQLIFFIISIYGWWHWTHPKVPQKKSSVSRLKPLEWTASLGALVVIWGATLWMLLQSSDGSNMVLDSLILSMGLVAQALMAMKKIENWAFWILFNLLSGFVSAWNGLYITTTLYMIFLMLCWIGVRSWRKSLSEAGP